MKLRVRYLPDGKLNREERERSMEYEHSAQVVDIMGRGAYSLIINHQGLYS